MNGTGDGEKRHPDSAATEQARRGLEQAEAGDARSAKQLDEARKSNPASVEAAEQEASDGPKGVGLSR